MDTFEALQVIGHADIPALLPLAPAWQRDAMCAGEDVERFYPEQGAKAEVAAARELCSWCPVSAQCLAWAIEHDEYGTWAGTTREQRKAMGRQQAA